MEDKRQKPIRGIRIRTLNFVMIAVSCVLYVLLIAATIHVSRSYTDVHTSMDDYIGCEQSDTLLTEGSAYLTEQVRLYVVTLDPQCIENYFIEANATRRREKALEQLQVHHDSEEAYRFLVEALENSNDLMVREIHAMRLAAQASGQNLSELPEAVRAVRLSGNELSLTPDEQLSRAREMVFGDAYQASKALITGNVEYSLGTIHSATHQEMLHSAEELERTMSQQRVLISVLFVESLITFILIILLIVKPLQIYVNCIKEDKMMEIVGSYEFKYLALTYNDIYEVNAANEMMLRHKAEHDPPHRHHEPGGIRPPAGPPGGQGHAFGPAHHRRGLLQAGQRRLRPRGWRSGAQKGGPAFVGELSQHRLPRPHRRGRVRHDPY